MVKQKKQGKDDTHGNPKILIRQKEHPVLTTPQADTGERSHYFGMMPFKVSQWEQLSRSPHMQR